MQLDFQRDLLFTKREQRQKDIYRADFAVLKTLHSQVIFVLETMSLNKDFVITLTCCSPHCKLHEQVVIFNYSVLIFMPQLHNEAFAAKQKFHLLSKENRYNYIE